MIFNSDSYDALMSMEEARTGHYGEDYFDNGRPDDYWDVFSEQISPLHLIIIHQYF